MSSGDTTLTITGNLTGDPELRFTATGTAVVAFTVAASRRVYDQATGQWQDGDTLFLRCSAWRRAGRPRRRIPVQGDAGDRHRPPQADGHRDRPVHHHHPRGWTVEASSPVIFRRQPPSTARPDAADTLVTQAQNPLPVGDADDIDLPPGPVMQDLPDAVAVGVGNEKPAAMVRAPNDGAGSFPAANARMAEDLEVPRPLRLILTLSIQRKAVFRRRACSTWASSTNTSRPHRSQGQDRWPSSGTPQALPVC